MTGDLPDETIDAISFESLPSARRLVAVYGAEGFPAIADLLSLQGWSHLRYYADCAKDAMGGEFDDIGFSYDTDEVWPGDKSFKGVRVFVPWDEATVSRAAFDRLMARFFRVVVLAAAAREDPVIREPWWPEFLTAVEAIERRADMPIPLRSLPRDKSPTE